MTSWRSTYPKNKVAAQQINTCFVNARAFRHATSPCHLLSFCRLVHPTSHKPHADPTMLITNAMLRKWQNASHNTVHTNNHYTVFAQMCQHQIPTQLTRHERTIQHYYSPLTTSPPHFEHRLPLLMPTHMQALRSIVYTVPILHMLIIQGPIAKRSKHSCQPTAQRYTKVGKREGDKRQYSFRSKQWFGIETAIICMGCMSG